MYGGGHMGRSTSLFVGMFLLPAGSEEHEVLQTGSIHLAILPSCQSFATVHLKCLNCAFIWVVKIRNISEAVFRPQNASRTSY